MRSVFAGAPAVPAMVALMSASVASAAYTPLAFGPLDDPGSGLYFTQVHDISADGMSYVGVLSNNTVRVKAGGVLYTTSGVGAPQRLSPDGMVAVGGLHGATPQRWNIADAVGTNLPGTDIAFAGGPNPAYGLVYGTNNGATAFSISTPTGVLTGGGFVRANDAFTAVDPGAFAGANRGMAAFAPVAVLMGHVPGVDAFGWRWNYESGALQPLTSPAGATSINIGGVGGELSGDGSMVGGSITIPSQTPLGQPAYWDAAGMGHIVPGVDGRIWGNMSAMNYSGTIGGGNLFGPGLTNHAFIHEFASGESYDLNEVFAPFIPDGWILTATQHISDDGSRIYCHALAPDGTTRVVVLDGEVPAPGAAVLFAAAGMLAGGRRRR